MLTAEDLLKIRVDSKAGLDGFFGSTLVKAVGEVGLNAADVIIGKGIRADDERKAEFFRIGFCFLKQSVCSGDGFFS